MPHEIRGCSDSCSEPFIQIPTAEALGYLVPSRLAGLVDSGSGMIANNALFNPSREAEYASKCHEP
jgi:hypothetical protein